MNNSEFDYHQDSRQQYALKLGNDVIYYPRQKAAFPKNRRGNNMRFLKNNPVIHRFVKPLGFSLQISISMYFLKRLSLVSGFFADPKP
jgi:hypothetical protein